MSGIVGYGKTTIIERTLESLGTEFNIIRYTGDDIQFRNAVLKDSRYIFNDIRSQSTSLNKTLVFVDEVQQSEEIFDALKFGIVTYLKGETSKNLGPQIEGYVHARLSYLIQNSVYK